MTGGSSAEEAEGGDGHRWRAAWFPLAFAEDLTASLYRITLGDQGYALFRTPAGWRCVIDRCPHRGARLSDGEVRDGVLSCRYHGWAFDGDGRCTAIPQLDTALSIPAKAHVSAYTVREAQGIVWLWPADDAEPDEAVMPLVPDLDRPDCTSIDFAIDLPYEQSFLIENVIDIAHIHVAHDGIRGGGHRALAAPIDFDIDDQAAAGFEAAFRSVGAEAGDGALRGAKVRFVAPNLVHYQSLYADDELCSGLALYSLPMGDNRCRLLYRAYSNFWRLRDRLRPRWVEHFTQCAILEQDMAVVVGQAEDMLRDGRPTRAQWLPIKSSDALVVAYRRWLDRFQVDPGPARVGFDRLRTEDVRSAEPYDRFRMHAEQCSACSRAHGLLVGSRTPLVFAVVASLAVAAATAGTPVAVGAGGLAVALTAGRFVVDRLARRFHVAWAPDAA